MGIAMAVQFSAVSNFADGCFVWRWDKKRDINEPTQKAIILHDGGREDLLLQVKFEGAVEDFGWLIPAPSLPKVERGSMEAFYELSKLTQGSIAYGGAGAMGNSSGGGGAPRVRVIEAKTVGAYAVSVLAADDAGSLERWLKENGYSIPGGQMEREIVEDYIRRGWFFVAAKIDLNAGKGFRVVAAKGESAADAEKTKSAIKKELASGELHPLLLSFETPKCMFPLKISAVSGKPSEVSLYVISEKPLINTSVFEESRARLEKTTRQVRENMINPSGYVSPIFGKADGDQALMEDRQAIMREYSRSVREVSLEDELYGYWGGAHDLMWMGVKPKEISKAAKSIPRLKEKNWWIMKMDHRFEAAEMRDLEFEEAIPYLAAELRKPLGGVAAGALERLGAGGLEELIRAAKSDDSMERQNATLAFERIRNPRVAEVLLPLLRDPKPAVRWHAARAAAVNWDTRMVDPMVELFQDESREVRETAVRCLQWHDAPKQAAKYVAMLRSPDVNVRICSLEVLGEATTAAAIPTEMLRECLKNSNADLQNAAIKIIGTLRFEAVTREDLLAVLNSSRMDTIMMALNLIDKKAGSADSPTSSGRPGRSLTTLEAEALATNRLAAARSWAPPAFQRNGDAKAIELTLGLLRDSNGVVRRRAFLAMKAIAGENISETDPAAWENWWKTNEVTRVRLGAEKVQP